MTRRRFVRTLGFGQARPDSVSGAADPLGRPGWVGRPRPVTEAGDNDEKVKAIERRLRCTCGCGLDVFICRTTDFACTYSPALHQEVVALVASGRGPDQVIEDFVAKYGESVLMAPQARGFGILGYVLPGAALLVGGSLLAWVLTRRTRLAARVPAPAAPPGSPPPASADDLARVEQALRELD
jgi:cytochrome c-type biogenesis protein CcmH